METSFVAGPAGFIKLVHVPLIDMKSALGTPHSANPAGPGPLFKHETSGIYI
jgi:hypothetical protein